MNSNKYDFESKCAYVEEQWKNGVDVFPVLFQDYSSELNKFWDEGGKDLALKAITIDANNARCLYKYSVDKELCKAVLEAPNGNLSLIPKHMHDDEIYRMALDSNALENLPHIPNKNWYWCEYAIKQDVRCLQHIPDIYKTYDMCLEAVSKCSYLLEYVPLHFRSHKMCLEAVCAFPDKKELPAICHVPSSILNQSFADMALVYDPRCIAFISPSVYSHNAAMSVVKMNGRLLQYVAIGCITEDLCCLAMQNVSEDNDLMVPLDIFSLAPHPLACLPICIRTERICRAAYEQSGDEVMEFIPENIQVTMSTDNADFDDMYKEEEYRRR